MSEFCEHGCYWPDCEHRAQPVEVPPPAGTRWVERAGLRVPAREPQARPSLMDGAVDEFVGELLPLAGRPWSLR